LILINQQSARPLQLGLLNFEGTFSSNVSVLSAGTLIGMVRMILAVGRSWYAVILQARALRCSGRFPRRL
jgi:hypothetical protein